MAGVSSPLYLDGENPSPKLECDNSYALFRLHDAQAFVHLGPLTRPRFLIIGSEIGGSFCGEIVLRSLYTTSIIRKNSPTQLGLSFNFTEWLPVRSTDSVKIHLNYLVVQDSPFKELVDQSGQINLASKLALVRPEWAVATKMSEIVGRMLSYLLGEGRSRELFSLRFDFNFADLRPGYYAVVGSDRDEPLPTKLRIENGQLKDRMGNPLCQESYAVIEVIALPRLGQEAARGALWWEALQVGKEQLRKYEPLVDGQARRSALDSWKSTLSQVQVLARKDHSFLLAEIQQIIQVAHTEVMTVLRTTTTEARSPNLLPEDWQELLGASTESALQQSVLSYQTLLESSKLVRERYQSQE
jgi:hypothetical protein